MAETCVAPTQDMPMCERKDVLNKLQEMVNDLEKTQKSIRQVPRVLIRSDVCECHDAKKGLHESIQRERGKEKMPPQYFDFPRGGGDGPAKDGGPGNEKNVGDRSKSSGGAVGEVSGVTGGSGPQGAGKRKSQGTTEGNAAGAQYAKEGGNESSCFRPKSTSTQKPQKPLCTEDPLPEERRIDGPHPLIPVPKPHTFELRGSKMLVGCDCLRRNGMQHDCKRTLCQGKRECLKFPAPVCHPSGLAPPIIVPSPIITVDEPDCGPKKPKEKTKTQIEQRKILLNYARAQFQDKPPRPLDKKAPCRYHKRGKYYIRPLQRVANTQTEGTPGNVENIPTK